MLYNIMSYCWAQQAEDRPDFDTLVEDFEKLLVQDTDYIDLNMFPEHAYYNEVSLSDEKVWPAVKKEESKRFRNKNTTEQQWNNNQTLSCQWQSVSLTGKKSQK